MMIRPMHRKLKTLTLAAVLQAAALSSFGFSMLGPYDSWQEPRIGYAAAYQIGGPMNLGEEYRWNIKTVYYGYDQSYLQFFGQEGVNAAERAFAILNALPPVSQMSSNLSEFPLDTRRNNSTAAALNLLDVGATTLESVLELMGLASPEDFVWTLRSRVELQNPARTNYAVIKRNFDPVTLLPSSYVNGTLYTYFISDPQSPQIADAFEVQVDPLQFGFTSVASGLATLGDYYTGLTRDDVGGLRHLYGNAYPLEHWHVETLPLGTTGSSGGSPWTPIGGGGTGLISFVDQAVRPGVDKVTFVRGQYDSIIGSFIALTNIWTDTYISNGVARSQTVQRAVLNPDILFLVEDLGINDDGSPVLFRRSDTAGWNNNDAINGSSTLAGPGVIDGPVFFRFSPIGSYYVNQDPFFADEYSFLAAGVVWGSFDGTTNPPVVFPNGTSIQQYQSQVVYGGFGADGSPWTIPNSFIIVTNTP